MAFQLRILFDGLCLIVPNSDESRGARVLMVDARAPGVASNGENHVSHVPSVRFALADLAPDRRQPAHRIEHSSQDPVARGQWHLNGDDLEIRANGAGLPDAPLTVLRQGLRNFDLIPSMRAIYPETQGVAVRDECLAAGLHRLADAGLAGRLRLQAGVLGAWDGAGGRFITPDEFMFTGNPSRHRQRIASRSFFETTIDADEVELFSRQRGHGLVLRPADAALVELVLENEPPAEMMSAKPSDPDADYDFELVYLIAKNPPRPLRIPIRATAAWERSAAAEATSNDRSACGPAQYNPGEEAHLNDLTACGHAQYNPHGEALPDDHEICAPAQYDPSAEAAGNPYCSPVAFNPSGEATAGDRPICPGAAYSPSGEAGLNSRPVCAGAAFAASDEAGIYDRTICPATTFNPSDEAGVYERILCAATTFSPSDEAGGNARSLCFGVIFDPSDEA